MKRLAQWMNSRLLRSEHGSAMPMIGLGIMALIGSTGIAVDMGRVQVAQSRMSNSLDAAGLAAGSNVSTVDLNAEVTKYFNANFPPSYMGTQISSLTVTANDDLTNIVLDSTGQVPTTFMKIFGIHYVPISAHSVITRGSMGMELVLVIDTTGSMADSAGGGQSKMTAAKTASASLLNIVFGNQDTQENLWVGMVPFSQSVNVGSSRTSWMAPDTYNWGTTSWGGCVDAREAGNRDVTDDAPAPPSGGSPDTRFPKYYWPDDNSYNNWIGSNTTGPVNTTICNRNSSCTCANYGPCTTTTTGTAPNPVIQTTISCSGSGSNRSCNRAVTTTTTTYSINSSRGPNYMCEAYPVVPLTAHKSTVVDAINTLQPAGNTHIVLGASWGWRMLSPTWRNYWGGEMNTNNLPLDYHTPLMNKVVVLMTDGDNTIGNNVWGSYWYLNAGHLGTTNSSAAVTQLNNRLLTTCTNMKNNGIIIYTVAFGTDISSTARSMLQSCATKPDYYFYSPTGADLQTSFRQIGDSLANLRISQ